MAEPISAKRLRQLRAMAGGFNLISVDPISLTDVAALLARLDFAERRVAPVRAGVRGRGAGGRPPSSPSPPCLTTRCGGRR